MWISLTCVWSREDTILMCSDGLSNMVEDSKMEEIILNSDEDINWKGETLIRRPTTTAAKTTLQSYW